MNPPPALLRRLILAPAVLVCCVLVVSTLPISLVATAAASPLVPGRWRPLRLLWFAVLYLALEAVALVLLLVLWVATGFGVAVQAPWSQRAHYRLVGAFLRLLRWEAERVLGATIVSTGWNRGDHAGRPLVVLARHAGAGDSFLIVDMLISDLAREPRIVLKETLRWDPAFDLALGRLPARFIPSRPGSGEDVLQSIGELAVDLDGNDALLIFPEGGNFSPVRRQRAIDRLRDRGLHEQAAQAEALTWMLAPRPGGALAALQQAPDADVVVAGHAGMDQLDSLRELYRHLPLDHEVRVHWWFHPAATVPRDPTGFADWLLAQWAVVDAWVAANQPLPVPPPPAR